MQSPYPLLIPGARTPGWTIPGRLARGGQPPLTDAAAEALLAAGVGNVLSLRADGESFFPDASGPYKRYEAAEERFWCERFGLRFERLAWTDMALPRAAEIAGALRFLERSLDEGRPVYVHCRAGLGRTGVVVGAWLLARESVTPAQALEHYRAYFHQRFDEDGDAEERRVGILDRCGVPEQTWGLGVLAVSLGLEPCAAVERLPAPRPPRGTDPEAWLEEAREHFAAWRRAAAGAPVP